MVSAVDQNLDKQQRCKRNDGLVSIKSFHLCLGEDDICGHHESSRQCSSTKHLQAATNAVQFLEAAL